MSKYVIASAAVAGLSLIDASGAQINAQGAFGNSPAVSWTGFFVGAEAGGSSQRMEYGGGFTGSNSSSSGAGGIYGGYQYQFNRLMVVGVEARYTRIGVDSRTTTGAVSLRNESNYESSLVGKLGFAVSDRVMLYGTAGGVFTDVKLSFPLIATEIKNSGLTAGGGLQFAFNNVTSFRFDYRHNFYNEVYGTFGDLRSKFDSDTYMAGFSINVTKALAVRT